MFDACVTLQTIFGLSRFAGRVLVAALALVAGIVIGRGAPAFAADPPGFANLRHIIIVMQENHSFDNYFGTLPYAGGPYHPPASAAKGCKPDDHQCVDGLRCQAGSSPLRCTNFNLDALGNKVFASHETTMCPADPGHGWVAMHRDLNFSDPDSGRVLNDGFARSNPGAGRHPMAFFERRDLPYYYALAETFALSDRYFAALPGPTLPDRMYAMAATSFGHIATSSVDDQPPGPPGYQPLGGTIFDLLDHAGVSWHEYYQCGANHVPPRPYAQMFRYEKSPNFVRLRHFYTDTQGKTCKLPAVSYVSLYHHEHPPQDVRSGEYDVSRLIHSLMTGPCWKSSILLLTYDEGGGFFDHVPPPPAVPPDKVPPGKCADRSNPPASTIPGGGANCSVSAAAQAQLIALRKPGEAVPGFNRYGFRVPLLAISPFAKPHYVSHVVADHTSLLRLIEERFLNGRHLTRRDGAAYDLTGMFDFQHSPSLHASLQPAIAPKAGPGDRGCSVWRNAPKMCEVPTPLRRASLPLASLFGPVGDSAH